MFLPVMRVLCAMKGIQHMVSNKASIQKSLLVFANLFIGFSFIGIGIVRDSLGAEGIWFTLLALAIHFKMKVAWVGMLVTAAFSAVICLNLIISLLPTSLNGGLHFSSNNNQLFQLGSLAHFSLAMLWTVYFALQFYFLNQPTTKAYFVRT
jgi:hypothetical protein